MTYLYQRPRFHDLRHSYVALLMDSGRDFYAIQQQLGHASVKTTFAIYGHLLPYGDEQHLANLDRRLPAAPSHRQEASVARPEGACTPEHRRT